MILHHHRPTFFVLVLTIVFTVTPRTARAQNSTLCQQTCGTEKSAIRVNYPFGFSSECKIPLNCTAAAEAAHITIGAFEVLNVTSSSILIQLPTACSRPLRTAAGLFSANYAPSWANGFLLETCASPLDGCLIPKSFVGSPFHVGNCGAGGANVSCFSNNNTRSDVILYKTLIATGCEGLFSSLTAVEPDMNSLELQVLQLVWWMQGSCRGNHACSPNANCTTVRLPDGQGPGFRCQCEDGFDGDGFIAGEGCRRVSRCNSSKYFSGRCGGHSRMGLLIGGLIAGASLMAGLVSMICFLRRRSSSLKSLMSAKRLLGETSNVVPLYPYKYIEKATSGFSDKQRLGTGAYGTVYAGKLHFDEWVAVKRIRSRDMDSIDQVMNEIKLLSSVDHPNLVRLLGCCIEKGEQILVYEFMPNGTLSQHLQKERGHGLPWTTRLTIAAETAHAIAYLHSVMNPPIYHRDIKSSNILLDYDYNTKVADFGLSRLGTAESELSHISTAPKGTPGYLDPQYHQNFHLSDKSDVYSFGVVLVEIITALKVVDFSRPHTEINLAALAIDRIGRGCVEEIIDPFLELHKDAWTLTSIHKVAELAFRCLAFHWDMRPSMMEVAEELEHIRQSGWATVGLDENVHVESSVASFCSCCDEDTRSISSLSMKKASIMSQRLVVTPKSIECLSPAPEEVQENSPVSVQDPWLSEQSSPSTKSQLSNVT